MWPLKKKKREVAKSAAARCEIEIGAIPAKTWTLSCNRSEWITINPPVPASKPGDLFTLDGLGGDMHPVAIGTPRRVLGVCGPYIHYEHLAGVYAGVRKVQTRSRLEQLGLRSITKEYADSFNPAPSPAPAPKPAPTRKPAKKASKKGRAA